MKMLKSTRLPKSPMRSDLCNGPLGAGDQSADRSSLGVAMNVKGGVRP